MYLLFIPNGQMLLVYVMAGATAAILRVRGELARAKPKAGNSSAAEEMNINPRRCFQLPNDSAFLELS